MTKTQEYQYVEEPNLYVADQDDEMSLRSIRNASLDLINQLIENFDDLTVEAVLYVAERFITQKPEAKAISIDDLNFENINVLEFSYDSPNPNHALKKKEVGLLLIGTVAEDI